MFVELVCCLVTNLAPNLKRILINQDFSVLRDCCCRLGKLPQSALRLSSFDRPTVWFSFHDYGWWAL